LVRLLEDGGSACFLELGNCSLCIRLRHAFLENAETFDCLLCLCKAKARELADDLDDADLVCAEILEDDVELGLLLFCGSSLSCACACNCNGSGSGNAELLLKRLDELVELDNGHRLDFFDKLLDIHDQFSLFSFLRFL